MEGKTLHVPILKYNFHVKINTSIRDKPTSQLWPLYISVFLLCACNWQHHCLMLDHQLDPEDLISIRPTGGAPRAQTRLHAAAA